MNTVFLETQGRCPTLYNWMEAHKIIHILYADARITEKEHKFLIETSDLAYNSLPIPELEAYDSILEENRELLDTEEYEWLKDWWKN